ncbi:MAG: nucleotidyltransferase domain-containing protein [archaeon]
MSKKLISSLKKKLKGINLNEIVDVFLFGSAVKGKEFPHDLDICIVFRKKIISEIAYEIESRLKEYSVHISTLVVDNFFMKNHSLAKTLFVEGVSILTGRQFIESFGFKSYSLYTYDLSKLGASKKVQFVQLLKGRNTEGIVKRNGGEWIVDRCFIMPVSKDSEMLIIFKKWEVPYKKMEALIH